MRQLFSLGLVMVASFNWTNVQAQNDKVNITWVSPVATEFNHTEETLPIEVMITSEETIDKNAIFVELNNQLAADKADVVKFGQLDKKETKFSFADEVALKEGENKIKIGYKLEDGHIIYSLPKVLKKEGIKITEVVIGHVSSGKGIFWDSPRWQSTPLVIDQRQFRMNAMINSPVQVKKNDIYLVRQGFIKVPIAPDSKLKEIAPGKYEFSNTMQLEGEGLVEIVIKVKSTLAGTIESDPLTINFSPHRPNIHLLSVGTQTNLNYTMNDATDFASTFEAQGQDQGGQLFNKVDVTLLTGQNATATAIKGAIEKLETKFKNGQIGKKDIILLYLSSHGFLDDKRRLRIQGDDYDPGAWRTTSVSYERDIIEILEGVPCKKLIFIDACHSGGGGAKGEEDEVRYRIEQLNKTLRGVTSIVSSSGSESSYEDEAWQNGAFTESIVEGLLGKKADTDRNKLVTINELWYYIKERVPYLVKEIKKKAQHPQIIANELGDVAIFSIR